jgi:NADPH:quinone reductase-like Zn-dependent oxidoreductase
VTTASGAAEYAVAPVANCVKLPDHVRTQDTALVEPLSCAVRGYDVLRSRLGAHVLIYGSGTMGLTMLESAERTGAAGGHLTGRYSLGRLSPPPLRSWTCHALRDSPTPSTPTAP